MKQSMDGCEGIRIVSPVTGNAVPVDQVPDPVFSQKIIGDGIAVVPEDGRILSPVDGEVVSVAETLHAYGFRSAEGVEVLVHFGLETVALKGEYFKCHVKTGDLVKAGDLIAEADLAGLREKQVDTITPVLVCGGLEGRTMNTATGPVKAGETEIITVLDDCNGDERKEGAAEGASGTGMGSGPERETKAAGAISGGKAEKKKGKALINFDFLQKLGKVLMTVIAVMPAAGLMISVGKLVQMAGADFGVVMTIGSTMETIGWAVINNLHILFAVAIGGSWAKEKAGGAFAAVIAFILINVITGAVFGVSSADLADPAAVTHTLFGKEILVNGYFTSVLGAPALNMGVFIGIISGVFQRQAVRANGGDSLVRDHLSGAGRCVAGGAVGDQQLRRLDRQFLRHLPCAGPVHLRNPGAHAVALWTASYADDSHELHILRRHLHHADRGQRRGAGLWTGPALAGLGHGFD